VKKLLPLLALFALVLSACGGGSGVVAATVNETDITVGDVDALMDPDGATVSKEQFAQFLSFRIRWVITEDGAAENFDITISEEEMEAEADRIYDEVNADESREDFLSNRGITEEFLVNIAHQGLLDLAIREELAAEVPEPTQDEIDAEMAIAEASLTEVCVSHILVETQDDVDTVVGRLEAGDDFGELAIEFSQDPGSAENGGVLPCGSAGQYVEEFRDATLVAPINEIYEEIVETQFGFHIIMVTDRTEPSPEELPTEQEVSDSLKSQAAGLQYNIWLSDQVLSAEVTVDPEYGTWNTDGDPQVIAPTE